jgi:hypothetical protein
MAQTQQEDQAAAEGLLSTTTVGLIPVTTTYFVLMWQFEGRKQELQERVKRLESIVLIEDYLDVHEDDVRLAFTLGAGDALDDLTALMHLGPDQVVLSSARARRPVWREILALTDRRERATRLYDTLADELTTNHAQGGVR